MPYSHRARDGEMSWVSSQPGHDFIDNFLRLPNALQVQVEEMLHIAAALALNDVP